MLQAAQWLERTATAQGAYPATLPDALKSVESNAYTIVLDKTKSSDGAFTLLATRQDSQVNDKCGDYTLTNTGIRDTVSGTLSAAECWVR
ncbi:MAG: type IV pilin protein [Methylobacillus sp.]|nr:type IV pilin protein [Methylobacillus sp.]